MQDKIYIGSDIGRKVIPLFFHASDLEIEFLDRVVIIVFSQFAFRWFVCKKNPCLFCFSPDFHFHRKDEKCRSGKEKVRAKSMETILLSKLVFKILRPVEVDEDKK